MRKILQSKLRLLESRLSPVSAPIARAGSIVVVVEHDDAIRDSLRELLESCGHTVTCFSSATDFLAGLAGLERGCLVLDAQLPKPSGCGVLAIMKGKGVSLPTIMTTSVSDPSLKERALANGAQSFLVKPWTADEFLRALEFAQQSARVSVH